VRGNRLPSRKRRVCRVLQTGPGRPLSAGRKPAIFNDYDLIGQVGLPEKEHLAQWTSIFEVRGVADDEVLVYSVLDMARAAADRFGPWRSWGFITLQIQLAAEQLDKARVRGPAEFQLSHDPIPEEPDSDWAKAKAQIRSQISEIAFLNWFACTWQIETCGSRIEVAVPDEPTKAWLKGEYELVISEATSGLGVAEIRFVVCDPVSRSLEISRAP
jgi:hypothetical protein